MPRSTCCIFLMWSLPQQSCVSTAGHVANHKIHCYKSGADRLFSCSTLGRSNRSKHNSQSSSHPYFQPEIHQRLIDARVEPVTDPLLTQEQAGFRHGRSTVDQVTLLAHDIEDSFSAKKAGIAFVDLTAAYDTVWHRSLTCTLPRLLPDRHMARMIMEMVGNHIFTLTTGNGKRSRLRHPKNGVP